MRASSIAASVDIEKSDRRERGGNKHSALSREFQSAYSVHVAFLAVYGSHLSFGRTRREGSTRPDNEIPESDRFLADRDKLQFLIMRQTHGIQIPRPMRQPSLRPSPVFILARNRKALVEGDAMLVFQA